MAPLVSIAVPFHDTARFLPVALDSLLAQEHVHWECLLWDDGSTDGSGAIAADYVRRDARFRLLGDGRNHGVGAASANALTAAQGEFVGVLDADDLLEPNALSSMLAFLAARPHVGMAYSRYIEIDEDGEMLRPGTRCLVPYSPQRLLLDFMTYHFRLMRTEAYRAIGGFDPAMRVSADYDLCLRMSERFPIEHLPMALYRYRIRRSSISQAGRLRQVRASFDAAQRAVHRRGLDRDHAFALGLRARHVLHPRSTGNDAPDASAAAEAAVAEVLRECPPYDPANAAPGSDWADEIEARYHAFVEGVRQRGLQGRYDCALELDSWHVLQPLRPFGGVGNWR